jgi:hypothetical protein
MRLARSLCYSRFCIAKVAELADAPDLGSGTERCGGSSPPFRTTEQRLEIRGQQIRSLIARVNTVNEAYFLVPSL